MHTAMAGQPMLALGLMSGTSYDAIDAALIETDGMGHVRPIAAHEEAYTQAERDAIAAVTADALAWGRDIVAGDGETRAGSIGPGHPESFALASQIITAAHARAALALVEAAGVGLEALDLIGFHGQTVFHCPPENRPGFTVQLGDGDGLARLCRTDVVYDFRQSDMAAGGQGAPLAPVYHWALACRDGLGDVAILNLGGVGNISFVTPDAADLVAFDTGPANGLLDQWVSEQGAGTCDVGGKLAAAGQVDDAALAQLLAHSHFERPPPKSLDRYAFSLDPVRHLSLEDGCATLTAFTAHTIDLALAFAPRPPRDILVAGGGVNNPTLMAAIGDVLPCPVRPVSALGWNTDALEAELMAYLAVRSVRGLPLSFPGTTGVVEPLTGGVVAQKG